MMLTEGRMSDRKDALMLAALPRSSAVTADRGYDSDWFRQVAEAVPVDSTLSAYYLSYCDDIIGGSMIPTYTIPYRDGELRIGWASWDQGNYKDRSIKYAYKDASGKISRGSPELPFDILVDMLLLAASQGELRSQLHSTAAAAALDQASTDALQEEKRRLSIALMTLQQLVMEFRWADWGLVYDQLGNRFEEVKSELAKRGVHK